MNYKPVIVSILLIIILLAIYIFFSPPVAHVDTPVGTTTPPTTETPSTDDDRVRAPEEVTLRVGHTGEGAGLTITFNELTNDYRCPVDVNCIQAGAVVANITLTDGSETITFNKPSDEVPTWWRGYEVSIVSVSPEARSTVTINPQDYVVTFLITPNPETNGNEPLI